LLIANFLPFEILDRLDRRARHDNHDVVGERTRAERDDLDVLALLDGGDHRRRRHVAVAELARDRAAHRGAAARARDHPGNVDAGLLEETLLDGDAVGRARRVGLVLGDDHFLRLRRQREAESGDQRRELRHAFLPAITISLEHFRE